MEPWTNCSLMTATIGEQITLSQYRGQKNVVLAFYVLDWTGT